MIYLNLKPDAMTKFIDNICFVEHVKTERVGKILDSLVDSSNHCVLEVTVGMKHKYVERIQEDLEYLFFTFVLLRGRMTVDGRYRFVCDSNNLRPYLVSWHQDMLAPNKLCYGVLRYIIKQDLKQMYYVVDLYEIVI